MIAILGESDADTDVLVAIIKKIMAQPNLPTKKLGYRGGTDLLRSGARDIRMFCRQGIKHFVVCHDADTSSYEAVQERVYSRVIKPAGLSSLYCIAVPVQELEAWIIADHEAVQATLKKFRLKEEPNPESIRNPKEWIVRQSRAQRVTPLYVPTMHNPRVAERISIERVARKCPSFARFREAVASWSIRSSSGAQRG